MSPTTPETLQHASNNLEEPMQLPTGPITRQRAKKIREAFAGLAQSYVTSYSNQVKCKPETYMGITREVPKLFHLTQIISD